MKPDKYFYHLDAMLATEPTSGLHHCRVDGSLLRLDQWDGNTGDETPVLLDGVIEAFVLVLDGDINVVDTRRRTELQVLEGEVCSLPTAWEGRYRLGVAGRCVVAAMPAVSGDSPDGEFSNPSKFSFDEALEDKYDGWRFYAQDGEYMTVGCSYRTAPPPSKETPHTHAGEQFNVAAEGVFEMTIGGVVHEITRGWASHIPPETLHTGEHKQFPYFQIIFSTPPRGSDYDRFLAGIYEAEISR